jgi:hypothetical protein
MLDSLSGDVTQIEWRTLPVNVVMAWAPLLSGATLGPDRASGGLLQASPELTALIVLAVAVVTIVQPYLLAAIEAPVGTGRRARCRGAAPGELNPGRRSRAH